MPLPRRRLRCASALRVAFAALRTRGAAAASERAALLSFTRARHAARAICRYSRARENAIGRYEDMAAENPDRHFRY